MWLSQLGKTIQPSDVLLNLTKFSITISEGIVNPNSSFGLITNETPLVLNWESPSVKLIFEVVSGT